MLSKKYPDIQVRIANARSLIGSNISYKEKFYSSDYAHYLRKLIRELDIAKNVVALPALSANEVLRELRRARLFVLPSLMENSSNSMCEAMMVGTPVIATYVGGTPSLIRDGVTGRLVPPFDPWMLAESIDEAFRNPDLYRSFAKEAKEVARYRHDPMHNAKALLSVYAEISK